MGMGMGILDGRMASVYLFPVLLTGFDLLRSAQVPAALSTRDSQETTFYLSDSRSSQSNQTQLRLDSVLTLYQVLIDT